MIRRELPTFNADNTKPEAIAAALGEFRDVVSARLAAIEAGRRVAVLDDVSIETGASLAVGTAPFPIRVQTPFTVAGAFVVLCDCISHGEGGVATSGVSAWVRPVSGGVDGSAQAMEIQFISGLAVSRKYRIRLGVVGVKNG